MMELSKQRKIKISILKNKLKTTKGVKKRRRLKQALRNQYQKSQDTKPELQTKYILDLMGVRYSKQFPLSGYYYDFILPDYRILLEINGSYWHASPLLYKKATWNALQKRNHNRDKRKMAVAMSHGYRIIYIWEGDLKNKARKVKARLEKFIANIENEKKAFHILEELFPQYREFYLKPEKKKKKVVIVETKKEPAES